METKKWVCPVCGYVHEGPEPPERCPQCKVPGSKFKELTEKAEGLQFVTEHVVGIAKEIPDTLGSGIWQSERNVLMALQVLSECEAVIEKEELAVRNALVETSYNTLPQPGTQLVVCENGDYQIVASNEQNIIEI
jgi:rubredoxin